MDDDASRISSTYLKHTYLKQMSSYSETTPPSFRVIPQRSRPQEEFVPYKREQARLSRRRLYPVTAFYTAYFVVVAAFVLRSARPVVGAAMALAGAFFWTLIEYLSHRYILHGRFPPGEGIVRRFLHQRLDPLHWEHHERPWDGLHINGVLRDLLPLFAVCAPLSYLFPIYTAPVFLAAVVQAYVIEEWVHHSTHFYAFRNPYFRYIQRHHRYHHSPAGERRGYGLTSGFWDMVFDTRFPPEIRRALYARPRAGDPDSDR